MTLKEHLERLKIPYKNINNIEKAFYHTSYVNEHKQLDICDNERLEFIGDAVLQLWSAEFLYHQKPIISEGDMTLTRAKLVSETALSTFARHLELGQFLKLGQGEIKNNGRERNSILADMFEALIGALYLDSGFDGVNVLLNLSVATAFKGIEEKDLMDYKTKLQEFVQSDTRKTVTYEIVDTMGSANDPVFHAVVKLDDIILGSGQGRSKKKAQQQAAKAALDKLAK